MTALASSLMVFASLLIKAVGAHSEQGFAYPFCKHDLGKLWFTVRLSKEIKKMMEEMKEVNWQVELRKLIEGRVGEEYKRRILNEMRK